MIQLRSIAYSTRTGTEPLVPNPNSTQQNYRDQNEKRRPKRHQTSQPLEQQYEEECHKQAHDISLDPDLISDARFWKAVINHFLTEITIGSFAVIRVVLSAYPRKADEKGAEAPFRPRQEAFARIRSNWFAARVMP